MEVLFLANYKWNKHKTLIKGDKEDIIDYLCIVLDTMIRDLKILVKELKKYLCTQVSLQETKDKVILEINGNFKNRLPEPN